MIPPELSELVIEKTLVNKWRGTSLMNIPFEDYKGIQALNLYDHFEINSRFIERAVLHGDQPFIQWLYRKNHSAFNIDLLMWAASCGRIKMCQWLWEQFGSTPEGANVALAAAARYGHIPVVEWAFPKANEWETAVQSAAGNGHVHIIEWISNRVPREKMLASSAMLVASTNGRFYAVKWLYAHYPEMCDYNVFNWAAGNGHYEIAEWLHANSRHEPFCTIVSILVATKKGNLKMVKWLYENRPELEESLNIVKAVAEVFNQTTILDWVDQMLSE